MYGITYKVDAGGDSWNDYSQWPTSGKDTVQKSQKSNKEQTQSTSGSKCACKNCKPTISNTELTKIKNTVRQQVINEITKELSTTITEKIDINKVVKKVIEVQEPHETKQTANINTNTKTSEKNKQDIQQNTQNIQQNTQNIQQNTDDISDFNNINIWATYNK